MKDNKRQPEVKVLDDETTVYRVMWQHTWLINGVRDEILPELCIILLFSKLDGLIHVLQLLHDHLQGSPAVSHPAWERRAHLDLNSKINILISEYLLSRKTVSSTKFLC